MDLNHLLSSILILYGWIVAAALIFFLFLIGRFYEIRFGQKSNYQLWLLPLVAFVLAAIWDAFLANDYTGNPLMDFVGHWGPDLLMLLGGVTLFVLCYSLYRTMMGDSKR
jgi:hypothetical protein